MRSISSVATCITLPSTRNVALPGTHSIVYSWKSAVGSKPSLFLRFLQTCSTMPNLTQAALLAGFGSYSQCHRVFSRVMGVSPRAYLGSELPGTQASLFEPLGPAQSIRCSPCAKEP
jgi:AraC-like DNA-binding protein